MAFAVTLSCDELGCPSRVTVALFVNERAFGEVLVDGDGTFTVDTEWLSIPEGWRITNVAGIHKTWCPDCVSHGPMAVQVIASVDGAGSG